MRVWLVVVVALTACATTKPACKVAEPLARDGAFLWRAQKGDAVLWLYGTIHDAGIEAVPAAALRAFDGAGRLVTELGDTEADSDVIIERAKMPYGKPGIDQLLPASDWYDLRDALLGVIKEDDLKRARPWYAMTLLTTHLDPHRGKSMDIELADRARGKSMPIEALETWDEQLAALDSVVDIAALQETIHARHSLVCDAGRLRTLYEAGDTVSMQATLVVPQTRDVILTARNAKWLPKLETYTSAFVAVGLGHLLGEQGLPAMLEKAGYAVERVR